MGSAVIETTWGFICDLGKALYNPKISDVVYDHKPITTTRVIKKAFVFWLTNTIITAIIYQAPTPARHQARAERTEII